MPKISLKSLGGFKSFRTKLINKFIVDNNIFSKQDMKTLQNNFGGGKTKKEILRDIRQLNLISEGKFEKLSRFKEYKERLKRKVVGDRKILKPRNILSLLRDDYDFYYDNKKLIIATNKVAQKAHKKGKGDRWFKALRDASKKVRDKEGKTLHQRHLDYFEKRKNEAKKRMIDAWKREKGEL